MLLLHFWRGDGSDFFNKYANMSDRLNRSHRVAVLLGIGLAALVASLQPAAAASHEQIIEMCRQSLMPQLHACVQGKIGNPRAAAGGELEKARQECGAAIVRPCVLREEQKAAAGVAAPSAPKDSAALPPANAVPVQTVFVAPPRTIADITAILDSEKPDTAQIAKRKADADAPVPNTRSPAELADFYYNRAAARALLGHSKDALADGLQGLSYGKNGVDVRTLARLRLLVAKQYKILGDPKSGIVLLDAQIREGMVPGRKGTVINAMTQMAETLIALGDVGQAGTYAGRASAMVQEARGSPNPNWRAAYQKYGRIWESDADTVHAVVLEARGQYAEAEAAYRRAEAFSRAAVKDLPNFDPPRPPPEQLLEGADRQLLSAARNEAKQNKLSQAEADARRALLGILKAQGKYSPTTPPFILGLAGILVEQGRYPEAEKLTRTALEIQRTIGVADSAPETVNILSGLGNVLILQRRTKEAAAVYAQLDAAMESWPPQQREAFELNSSRIASLYASGQIDAGIAAAQALVKLKTARTGEASFDTAAAHGTLAVGYARAGRATDATAEFKAAIPVLMASARENSDEDDPTVVAARNARLQRIVEAYIGVLARGANGSNEIGVETFALADAVRGHAVQQALADSSARTVAKDPALAELVRNEQDLAKQINAQLGALNNLLSLPSDQRDDQLVRAINATIEKLRGERATRDNEISRQFPAYAELVDPKPATVDGIKAALRPGEALLSFYFGQDASFVWAVPKDGAGRLCGDPDDGGGAREQDRAGCAEALEPHVDDGLRHSAVRSRCWPTIFTVRCSSRSRPAGRAPRA